MSTPEPKAEQNGRQLADVIKQFDTAMLVTQTPQQQLRARPMAIAERHKADTLYLAAAADKCAEHSANNEWLHVQPR